MAQKTLILAIETSGRIGSVAIAAGPRLLEEVLFSGPMRHSTEVFPAIHGLLNSFGRKPKDIEHIYISIGPGSFTGLRIAVSIAKTMHLANSVKVIAVDTLDVIAANVTNLVSEDIFHDLSNEPRIVNHEKIAVILDAKRGQFYIAVYQRTNNKYQKSSYELRATSQEKWGKIFPDSLMTASQFLDRFAGKAEPVWLLGEGLVYYADKFRAEGIYFLDERYWTPQAAKVHLLGWEMAMAGKFADPLTLQPKYLRRPEAKENLRPRA